MAIIQITVLSGVERRRHWSDERKLVLVEAAVVPGVSLRIAKARQDKWGQSSERHRQLLDQLEMQLEDVVATATEDELAAEIAVAKASAAGVPVVPFTRKKPTRAPLSADLPRHRVVVPAPESCPCCYGAELKKIGETITESREVVPRQRIVGLHPARGIWRVMV